MKNKVIGIDLGGTTSKFALLTQEGDILHQWAIPTCIEDEGSHIVPQMIHSIKETLKEEHIDISDLLGIGMGSPGQIDRQKKTVVGAYNLNWREIQELGQQFEAAFHLPFYIDNDANVAALGERWQGAGRQSDHMLLVTLGTGVGSGLVIDGHLLHGNKGSAGEVGHLTVERERPFQCTCGKWGCLETVASATGIINLAKRVLDERPELAKTSSLNEKGLNFSAKDVFDAAKSADPLAEQVVDQFVDYLGLALSHLANSLNPEYIVIGGGVSKAGDYLLQKIQQVYETNLFPPIFDSTHLVLAQLGNDAGVVGAAALVLRELGEKGA